MRKVLYLEPIGGIAGDMFLAAALDLGVPRDELERMLVGLSLRGWHLKVTKLRRHEISGTHVEVVSEVKDHAHTPLSAIEGLIQMASTLPDGVRRRALAVFRAIGEAEAKVHGVKVEEVEFHEVGAVDSIIDICGAACALELLGDPEVLSAPPPLGSGFVKTAHGNLPIPPPATLEILRDVPVRFEGQGELTTPTGAGILKAVARFEPPPALVLERVGYGVGTKDFPDRPNVLRASLGRRAAAAARETGGAHVVETNLDDCPPQLLGDLVEKLMAMGVMDAWVTPVTMKKGRPGHVLSVLAQAELRGQVVAALLTESTTLGVRTYKVEREVLERRLETVHTRFGPVRVKLGQGGGRILNAMPEFEDCRQRAAEHKASVKDVWAEAFALGQSLRR
jgi:uncharacterized protein (TIGR00299 family) protein